MQIAEMTHVLAHIFALLFSKGFGSVEEPTENTACDGTQDASGTGMGEGEGINDVSDQIDNEAQLLGSSEKVIVGNKFCLCVFFTRNSGSKLTCYLL